MDKDNLDIHTILTNLTTETLRTARAETLQQLTSAFCLTAVGLFLALIGLLGLLLKLGRLITCCILFAAQPVTMLFRQKKMNSKISLGIINNH